MITAKIIADSINVQGNRLTTFELRYPKFIHGEVKTHRVIRAGNEGGFELIQEVGLMDDPNLSRNASSSRAIPTEKLLEEVRSDTLRATPVFWGKNQKGMQAAEEFTGNDLLRAKLWWQGAALDAVHHAQIGLEIGVHKQLVNRVLEPYSHINVVCSATEYLNFFGLRLDRAAQPEARALAEAMWRAYGDSVPRGLTTASWHLPYVDDETRSNAVTYLEEHDPEFKTNLQQILIKVSVARCARVSYRSFETGKRSTVEEDLTLYDRLLGAQPLHASPAEHQATPDEFDENKRSPFSLDLGWWRRPDLHGNFIGWCQYRKMLPNEAVAPLPPEYQL